MFASEDQLDPVSAPPPGPRVFVSHSSRDAATARQIVVALESAGVDCWIAPRDIRAGADYNTEIMAGINVCDLMLLVFSRHSAESDPVAREIERAKNRKVTVIPIRLEPAKPSPGLEYLISTSQWVDAFPPPVDRHLEPIVAAVKAALKLEHDTPRPDPSAPPKYLGPYRILEKLGEGGMGVVVKAEQVSPVRRIVAIKIIKPGMDSKSVLARFQAEQQALAVMDHPNIARVFDAGVSDGGRAYFVMEFVPGEPITAYCDRHELGVRQRLELFRHVCSAVQHAHTKGIIHRDVKPDNVLVGVRDAQPAVKVIDFGIAKALHGRLGEHTYFTEQGQIIGTPSYMSPEQAEMNHLEIDTRTDIYGMGVLLYELLTGCLPFDTATLKAAANREIQRIIREEAPPRPSTRLTRLDADTAAAIAQRRRTQPGQLKSQLSSELEWIPLKAIRKDRTERYQTALELEQDIVNYLQGLPLTAGPESSLYQARKFLARHRGRFIAAMLLMAVATAALVTLRVLLSRQQRATEAAGLVGRLLDADISQVPAVVADVPAYRPWADPLLRRDLAVAANDSPQKLRASLALAPVDPGQADFLMDRLLTAQPQEVGVIRDALAPYSRPLVAKLWSVVLAPERGGETRRVRAAAALASYDPAAANWARCSPRVAAYLVGQSPVYFAAWCDAFRPVRHHLSAALRDIFHDPDPSHAAERGLAAGLLAEYAADDPRTLADLLMDADKRQFEIVYARLKDQSQSALPILAAELERKLPADADDDAREKLAKRQANAAATLLLTNSSPRAWQLLKHGPDPRARSYLVDRLGPLGVDPGLIVERLGLEDDLSIRRALVLSLGEFDPDAIAPDQSAALLRQLQDIYRQHPDPGLHAAAEWLLRSWKQEAWLDEVNQRLAADKEQRTAKLKAVADGTPGSPPRPPGWYVDCQGQTLVTVPGPIQFTMGSPLTEPRRQINETPYKIRIARTYAIAAKPVTVEEFRQFDPSFQLSDGFVRLPHLPAVTITWYQAAAYCNWLSKQDGLDSEQWCYEIVNGSILRSKEGYLGLQGYRLPTTFEMEYATRAGAVTARYYGQTEELLPKYAWYLMNGNVIDWPVGSKKPNDLGLFDVHGNVWCWCQNLAEEPADTDANGVIDDWERTLLIRDTDIRVLRGGSFEAQEWYLRSAAWLPCGAGSHRSNIGFRTARTLRLE